MERVFEGGQGNGPKLPGYGPRAICVCRILAGGKNVSGGRFNKGACGPRGAGKSSPGKFNKTIGYVSSNCLRVKDQYDDARCERPRNFEQIMQYSN